MSKLLYEIITKPAYRVIGLKWEGPCSEISSLKTMIQTMSERVVELDNAVEPKIQLGLSYHTRPDGFTHFSGYEVTEVQEIPQGMIEIHIPPYTHLVTKHQKGENIGATYEKIAQAISESQYRVCTSSDVKYYDNLPIKHERYPSNRDLNDPHFEILIPIEKKQ